MTMTDERARTDACPWWCAGSHDFGADSHYSDTYVVAGESAEAEVTGCYEDGEEVMADVGVCQCPSDPPAVWLAIGEWRLGSMHLRPTQARLMARYLLRAAEVVEADGAPGAGGG